ncbi:solute carrier family 46 member 3-like [Elysia marginata]|uniref:Solute carrier family 46 member 3-like n=1 Tax=Elysia marginata TaxID=1093978 RepID=A0AAV4FCC7_9GAST|nr:solute carrier family 46 member 3-like [Elysia marginata]
MLTTLCALIPSFFVNLLLGAYADQLGRRIIFIVPLAGGMARVAIVCAVAYWDLSTNFILLGYILAGLTGDLIAFVMVVYVYTADNTTQGKNRSFLMVVATAVNFIFYNMSQFASGYFIESAGYAWPMITGLGFMVLSFILVVFFLRETLDKSKVQKASLFAGVKGIFSFYFDKPLNPIYKRKDFILLGLVFFIYASAMSSSISTIFLMNEPFCWGSKQIGYVTSAFGLSHAVLSTLVMRLLQYAFSDEVLVIFSLLSCASGRFAFAFANADWQIYIAYTTGALEVSVLAVIRAILSRMVPKEKRGSLFASFSVMETATLAASGAGLNELYSHTVGEWRGLTFFVIGCVTCVSAALMIVYKIMISLRTPPQVRVTVDGPDQERSDINSAGSIQSQDGGEPA